jgi:3-oxoacyl-[acyl-carrier-protein] synthase-3
VVGRTPATETSAVHGAHFETYGKGARFAQVLGGGTSRPPNHPDTRAADNLFHMDAAAVLLMTFRHAPRFLEHLESAIPGGLAQLDVVIPHQASRLALDSHTRFGFRQTQIVRTLDCLGNCVAASIPLTLYAAIRCGRLRRGNRALLLGKGAGLSFGGVVFTY